MDALDNEIYLIERIAIFLATGTIVTNFVEFAGIATQRCLL